MEGGSLRFKPTYTTRDDETRQGVGRGDWVVFHRDNYNTEETVDDGQLIVSYKWGDENFSLQ